MSISPIMPIGIELYAYKQYEPDANLFKKQLEALGYSSTGNIQKDKVLLSLINSGNVQKVDSDSESEQALPWQGILDELRLTSTGNKDDDYNLIMQTITEKLASVTSEDEKNYYLDLIQKTDNAFAMQFDNSASVSAYSGMTGASYLSSLNMYFMLN